MNSKFKLVNILIAVVMIAGPLGITFSKAAANNTAQPIPFSQDWSNTGLITTNDDWSGIPGVIGYRGDNLTSATGADPQTILQPDDPGVVNVNANQSNPNTFTTGGVTEFELADPVVALAGSGTADAPYLLIALDTTGKTNIQVSYTLRDLESGTDNAVQQVALHYRVGNSGNFTNIPEAYVADATIGNDVKTTNVSITLPTACENVSLVQLRIMTTNAVGNDEWVGIDNISVTEGTAETAPYVSSTAPANGGTLTKDGDIEITFNEPVTVAAGWFDITCTVSGAHTATVTDADPVYTLNPGTDFTGGESCTVNVYAANVNDDDLEDPPDFMEENYTFTFNVAYACGDPYTAISAIQGDGMSTPLSGQTVSTEGIVVADYQTNAYVSGTRNGFFMQSLTPDADPNTSEGLFVYTTALDVAVGDHVRVMGEATEYNGLTELSPVSQIQVCSSGNSVTPSEFTLPATDLLDFERLEGMLVTIPQDLVISEYFNFDRYGEIMLAAERFMTFTAANEPSVDGFAAWQSNLQLNSITLDDGRETQNPDPAIHPNGQPFTLDNRFRGGDLVSNVTGVMDYEFSKYRIQPTQGATYTASNLRPEIPNLTPGDLTIASFNVLNYFTTIDTGAWICGPSGAMECRGADTTEELSRQRAKILAALSGINADIFGIMEIENDHPLGEGQSPDYAVADLVAGLNETFGAGTYAYIATGAIGTDAIKQAIIYKTAKVTPVGTFKLLTSSIDPRFIDTLNRPALAQVFEDNLTGATFVVAVNHLKSKGSACTGDPDLLDGQSNCNLTRKAAAQALVDWLANPDYFAGVNKTLIIGDLNSYDHEDPIDMIKLGADDTADTPDDFHDMMAERRGENAYGYVYDAQIGYLDYALANTALAARIVDVNFWHINADEPDLIDYDMTFKQNAQDALYAPDAYRSSDHDPVIITLSFNAAPIAHDMTVTTSEDVAVQIPLDVSDANDDSLTPSIVTQPAYGELTVNGLVVTYTPDTNYNGPDSFTYKVSDGELDSNTATVSITVTPVNDAPVANDMTETTAEDTAKAITLDASDIDGDTLIAEIVTGPAHGELTTSGLVVTYSPDANYNGPDSFTYKVSDGESESNIATVNITVTPANDAPVAHDMTETTAEDTAKAITLDASDIDGDTLIAEIVTGPAHGELTTSGLVVTYTPDANYNGPDSFTYKVSDGESESDIATVSITVTPANDAPVAHDMTETTAEDTAKAITLDASDIDDDTLIAEIVTSPAHGELTTSGLVVTYSPDANYNGPDSFTYKVSDGESESDIATVNITVTPVNDAPVAESFEVNMQENGSVEFTLLASDVEGDLLTYSLVSGPAHGTLECTGVNCTYTPDARWSGIDSFIFKANDGQADSNEATVTLNVIPLPRIYLPFISR